MAGVDVRPSKCSYLTHPSPNVVFLFLYHCFVLFICNFHSFHWRVNLQSSEIKQVSDKRPTWPRHTGNLKGLWYDLKLKSVSSRIIKIIPRNVKARLWSGFGKGLPLDGCQNEVSLYIWPPKSAGELSGLGGQGQLGIISSLLKK